jgi:hypothetical protein
LITPHAMQPLFSPIFTEIIYLRTSLSRILRKNAIIQPCFPIAKDVVFADALVQIKLCVKKPFLNLWLTAHHSDNFP